MFLIGKFPCYKLSQTIYPKKSMPYHLSIYHNAMYPIASQFSCFCILSRVSKLQTNYNLFTNSVLKTICYPSSANSSNWKRTHTCYFSDLSSCPTWTAYLYANQCPTHCFDVWNAPTDFQEKQIDSCKWNHNSESNFNWQNTSWEWNIHLSRFFIWKSQKS